MSLVLFLLSFLQAGDGLERLRTLEERLEKTESLSVKVVFDTTLVSEGGLRGKVEGSGTLQLKTGNKVHLKLEMVQDGEKQTFTLISDGKTLTVTGEQGKIQRMDTPKELNGNMCALLARVGLLYAAMLAPKTITGSDDPTKKEEPLKALVKVTEAHFDAGDPSAGLLKTKGEFSGKNVTFESSLWYEEPKARLMRRSTVIRAGGLKGTFNERYEDFGTNLEIPDSTFKP